MRNDDLDNVNGTGSESGSGRTSQQAGDPSTDTGAATSARSRDATRLRSVMDRASVRSATSSAPPATVATAAGTSRPTTIKTPPVAQRPIRTLMNDPSRSTPRPIAERREDPTTIPPTVAAAAAIAATAAARPASVRDFTNDAPRSAPAREAGSAPPPASPIRSGRRMRRPGLAAMAVIAGTAIGIGLYAGGANLISGIFGHHTEGQHQEANPSAVTDRPVPPPQEQQMPADTNRAVFPEPRPVNTASPTATTSIPAAPTPPDAGTINAHHDVADPIVTHGAAPHSALRDHASPTASRVYRYPPNVGVEDVEKPPTSQSSPRTSPPTGGRRSVAAGEPTANPQPSTNAVADRTAGDAPKPAPAKPAHAAVPHGAASHPASPVTVQVRATSDQAEANQIARRLKSKGAAGVAIVQTKQKDGSTLYRVRYAASGAGAQSAAVRAGYKKVWVVQKNKN